MTINKRVKITYTEQSKAIVTATTLEYSTDEGERLINDEILKESKELFLAAQEQVKLGNIQKAMEQTTKRKLP